MSFGKNRIQYLALSIMTIAIVLVIITLLALVIGALSCNNQYCYTHFASSFNIFDGLFILLMVVIFLCLITLFYQNKSKKKVYEETKPENEITRSRKAAVRYVALCLMAISLLFFVVALNTFSCNLEYCYPTVVSYSILSGYYVAMLLLILVFSIVAVLFREMIDNKIDASQQKRAFDRKIVLAILILAIGWISYLVLAGSFQCNEYSCSSPFLRTYGDLGAVFLFLEATTIIFAILIALYLRDDRKAKVQQYDKLQRTKLMKEKSKRLVYIVLALLMIFIMWNVLFIQNESLEGANHYTDDYLNSSAAVLTLVYLAFSWNKKSVGELMTQDRTIALLFLGAIVFQSFVVVTNLPFNSAYIIELMTDEIPGLMLALFVYINIYR